MKQSSFEYPKFAFTFMLFQVLAILSVEIIQVINLVQINDIVQTVQNFISLKILSEFDDFFVGFFSGTNIIKFLGKKIEVGDQDFR